MPIDGPGGVIKIGSRFLDYPKDMRGESPKRASRTATKSAQDKGKKRAKRKAQKKARRQAK